jgi:hypothetical protein
MKLPKTFPTGYLLVFALVVNAAGCSLFVMAGKSLFGDPVLTAPFTVASKVDLTEGMHRVLVVATTPEGIKAEFPMVNNNLIETVSRKLRVNGVKTIEQNDVATWLDDNGGYWDHIDELAATFDTQFIVHIQVDKFEFDTARSKDFIQGFASGTVHAYEVRQTGGEWTAHRILNRPFDFKYPEEHPALADRTSRESFQNEFLERISIRVSHMLYDHRSTEEVL